MKKIDADKGWFSAQELAGLPGVPKTYSGVLRFIERPGNEKILNSARTKVRGKGFEYALNSLPEITQRHLIGLIQDQAASAPGNLPSIPVAKNIAVPAKPGEIVIRGQKRKARVHSSLTDGQRAAEDAALVLYRALATAMAVADCSAAMAIKQLAERLAARAASPDLQAAAEATYVKPRKNAGYLGGAEAQVGRLRRLYDAALAGEKEGDVRKYLAPGKREKTGHNPIHVALFLQFYCTPAQLDVATVCRDYMKPALEARGLKAPSETTVQRIERDLAPTVKLRGRLTGAAYRALLPYVERDVSKFKANDIWVGDGHSFKAKVKSPLHGNAFVPEVTVVMDWVSRKIVGWSVALSESTLAVSDAFRHAQLRTRARPLIYYSDNGSGQTGKHIDHELTGSLARQGIAHETGRPGNPQGRGVIERWWPIVLIPLAQRYPTFAGKKADKETVRKISNELARAQRAGEDSPLLPNFKQFLLDLAVAIETYNSTHPHSALNGRTPDTVYAEKIDPASVGGVTDEEIACLWMPEEIRTPSRGRIELMNNVYHAPVLVHELREGEQVRVRFDIHNADQVWVYRMSGEFITVALWNGNKKDAFPVPYVERKRLERAAGIKDRAQKEVDRADAELLPTYEMEPLPQLSPEALPVAQEASTDKVEPPPQLNWEESMTLLWAEPDAPPEPPTDGVAEGQ